MEYVLSITEISIPILSSTEIPQVVDKSGGRTTAHVIDECRAGWLDESRDIFGVGNRQEHS